MISELIGLVAILLAIFLPAIVLGRYIAKVYMGQPTFTDFMAPLERLIARGAGISLKREMDWKANLLALISLNAVFFFWAMVVLLLQGVLPLNPDAIASMEPTQAFNTAVSFMTNTNLQHYSGESGATYFTQLFVFCFLQFVSAASGMAALACVFVAITRSESSETGNFYRFLILSCTRVLLPLAVLVAIGLLLGGVPATLQGSEHIITLAGDTVSVARGPVAPMVAIKQLGTNGGGYFGPNSTHPFENPSYLVNMLENWAILVLPVAMVFAFGFFANRRKEAQIFFMVMFAGMLLLLVPTILGEVGGNINLHPIGVVQPTGSLEGKEVRFGPMASALWGVCTTVTSNGSVNAMHDSFTALSGTFLLLGMMVNAFFGGVGVGFLNFYIFIVLAVFISGLMVGRTPELFGKKVEAREVKIASLVFLLHPFLILVGTALAAFGATGLGPDAGGWLANPGFHGFSEMLYEFTSSAANNGSGFEGLGDNTPFWNIATGVVMLLARFLPIIGPLAIAGMLAQKRAIPASAGTLETASSTFGLVTLFIILILSALAFFPVLILGPVAEHFSQFITQ